MALLQGLTIRPNNLVSSLISVPRALFLRFLARVWNLWRVFLFLWSFKEITLFQKRPILIDWALYEQKLSSSCEWSYISSLIYRFIISNLLILANLGNKISVWCAFIRESWNCRRVSKGPAQITGSRLL